MTNFRNQESAFPRSFNSERKVLAVLSPLRPLQPLIADARDAGLGARLSRQPVIPFHFGSHEPLKLDDPPATRDQSVSDFLYHWFGRQVDDAFRMTLGSEHCVKCPPSQGLDDDQRQKELLVPLPSRL